MTRHFISTHVFWLLLKLFVFFLPRFSLGLLCGPNQKYFTVFCHIVKNSGSQSGVQGALTGLQGLALCHNA